MVYILNIVCLHKTSLYNFIVYMKQNQQVFLSSCADYIKKYATEAALRGDEDGSSDSDGEISDLSEDEIQDMEL